MGFLVSQIEVIMTWTQPRPVFGQLDLDLKIGDTTTTLMQGKVMVLILFLLYVYVEWIEEEQNKK